MQRVSRWMGAAWKPLVGVAGLGVLMVWTSGGCRERTTPGNVAYESGLPLPPGAVTVLVSREQVRVPIDVTGTVTSEETVHLSARLQSYVREVKASAGQRVGRGDLLIALDDREQQEQLASAAARREQARSEFLRARRLLETQATTPQAFDAAQSAARAAEADYERASVMMSYAQITSPMDGVVTDRRVEVGDLASPGQVLLSIYDPSRMRLEAAVPVRLVDLLKLGQEVPVSLERPAATVTGIVSEIVGEVDAISRTQCVRMRLRGAGIEQVLPGTFGRAWVERAPRDAILVPASAVYRVGQQELAQVVRKGRVYRRIVRTGRPVGPRVEVLSGLDAGEAVLTTPIQED